MVLELLNTNKSTGCFVFSPEIKYKVMSIFLVNKRLIDILSIIRSHNLYVQPMLGPKCHLMSFIYFFKSLKSFFDPKQNNNLPFYFSLLQPMLI